MKLCSSKTFKSFEKSKEKLENDTVFKKLNKNNQNNYTGLSDIIMNEKEKFIQ